MCIKELKKILSNDFWRYFIYFCCISLFVVIMFALCSKTYFSNTLKTQTVEASENTLIQIRNAQDAIISEIDKSLTNVIFDPDFFSFKTSYSITKKFSMMEKLQRIATSNPYFSDVVIYYPQEGFVLSAYSGINSIDTYYDKDYILEVASKIPLINHAEPRIKYDTEIERNIGVISMAKTIPINSSSAPRAFIIADVDASSLNQLVNSVKTAARSYVVITNSSGDIIAQNRDLPELDLKHFLTEENLSVPYSVTGEINGENMFISRLNSSRHKWMCFYLTPTSALSGKINALNVFIFLLSLLVIFLSFVGSYILSQRLYEPIRKIAQRFLNGKKEKNHLAVIDENVNKLIAVNKDMNELLSDYKIHLKNKYLTELLSGEHKDVNSIAASLSYYDINFDINGYFIVFAMSIDTDSELKNDHSKKQNDMFMIYINELVTNEILAKYNGFSIGKSENMYMVTLNFDSKEDPKELADIAYAISREISTLFSTNLHYPFAIGVSNVYTGIANIQACCDEAVCALNYKLISGYNNIILYQSINSPEKSKIYPYDIEKDMCTALKARDREHLHRSVNQFAAYILDNPPDTEVIRLFFLQLLASTQRSMYDMGITFNDIGLSQNEIYTYMLNEPTIERLLARMNELHDTILNFEVQKRENKNRDILTSINEYIRMHLNADLSINRLAEIFYLSPSYLRKIYKDEYNVTIKQFIDFERIEHAKLLYETNPDIINIDVSNQIGYSSVQAFARAFKNHTGMAPGDYRTMVIRQRISTTDKEE